MLPPIKAPFPYFGGKSAIAPVVWQRFGAVRNYVEPFCGSAAMLLNVPTLPPIVTLNDADGLLVNFYRAVAAEPAAVAAILDWPVTELDLFARHVRLVAALDEVTTRLMADPDWYDVRLAAWWCWGACAWIGGDWCSGKGPWTVQEGQVVNRQLPHLGNAGRGVNRQLPHLGDAGQGVNRQLPHLGERGRGDRIRANLEAYMAAIRDRLRTARITCGDFARVLTPSVTTRHGLTAVFLDPPYGEGAMNYSAGGNAQALLMTRAREWAIAHADDPLLRIAICGYDLTMPDDWTSLRWKARKGYQQAGTASANNRDREIIWFSRHCLTKDIP